VTRSTRLSRMRPSSLARLPASSCISHSPTEPAAALLPGLLRPAPARQPPAAIARVNRVPSPSVPSPSSPFIHAVERRPDVPPPGPGVRCRLNFSGHDHGEYGAVLVDVAPPVRTSTVAVDCGYGLPTAFSPLPQIAYLGTVERPDEELRRLLLKDQRISGGCVSQPRAVEAIVAASGSASDNKAHRFQSTAILFSQTLCVVASNLDMKYRLVNRPIEVDFFRERSGSARPTASIDGQVAHAAAITAILVDGKLPRAPLQPVNPDPPPRKW
jgi:hypothetical protein